MKNDDGIETFKFDVEKDDTLKRINIAFIPLAASMISKEFIIEIEKVDKCFAHP